MTIPASHVSRRFLFALPLDALLDADAESISGRFRSPRSCSPLLLGARHFSGASLSATHPMSATECRAALTWKSATGSSGSTFRCSSRKQFKTGGAS